jgi:DNA-binding XRE family transcriptional regulator|tara:strand:- start:1949 stop:2182 length:234 start_codon:yes stop_codon:yes gene_type:complete
MSYGYSLKLIELNKASDKELLGVYLGAVCIKNDVPVAEVAQKLKVSRQAVYNWFTGVSNPNVQTAIKIEKLIDKLEQ